VNGGSADHPPTRQAGRPVSESAGPPPPTRSWEAAVEELTAPGQAFEMDEVEIRGVRTRVWKHAPPSAPDILQLSRGHGAADFLVYEDEHVTFDDHYRLAAAFAHRLRSEHGVAKGDRVAIAMRNLPEWVISFWGTLLAGAVAVPLNAWWSAEELSFALADSESVVVVADTQRADRLAPVLGSLSDLRALLVTDEHRAASGGAWSAPTPTSIAVHDFAQWLGDPPDDAEPPPTSLDPEDDATIFYTSGTTGRPKGAVGTHRNLCTNLMDLYFLRVSAAMRFGSGTDPGSEGGNEAGASTGSRVQNAYLLSVPLFHVTGCLAVMVANAAAGGKLVMMHHFDPERALELIERERITMFGGVPTMVMQVIDSPHFSRRDTSSIRSVSYGGAPAPPDLVRRIREHFPEGQPTNAYGLTETSSVTTMNAAWDYVQRPDSVGRPVPVCDVAVVPEDYAGDEPPAGVSPDPEASGELWIKGPNVVRGYWRRPEETAQVITKGWLHTGDVARIDADGFVQIVDRSKDTIIRGGENIYSVEVEDVLYEHPAVAECAVVGVPHPVLGEEVGAVVVLRPGQRLEAEELARHVRDHLAHFMVPTHFWFRRGPLPRNPNGKVVKRALRDSFGASPPPS